VSTDESQITAVLHAYAAALASRSVAQTLSLYTSDGVLLAPGYPASIGTRALQASYERIYAAAKLDITFDVCEIVLTGDEWAFARTTAEGTKTWLQRGGGGEQERHSNQEVFILNKEGPGGRWKIARYCFSSMKPAV